MIRTLIPTSSITDKMQTTGGWLMFAFPVKSDEPGQSLIFEEFITTEPTEQDVNDFEERCLNSVKTELIDKVNKYDVSDDVNAFILNGNIAWLDKNTRVGLVNSVNMRIKNGDELITLWLADQSLTLPCEAALAFLENLELYAMDCYNMTAQHKATILHETNIYNLFGYDYTAGYPEKLTINI